MSTGSQNQNGLMGLQQGNQTPSSMGMGLPPNMAFSPQPNQMMGQMQANQMGSNTSINNPNMLHPTNNKINSQFPDTPKSPTMVARVG